jgi:hypothetical protein
MNLVNREMREKCWRLDCLFNDEASGSYIVRNYITFFEDNLYLHWRAGSFSNPFRLNRIRCQKPICRALLSSLHIYEMASLSSDRNSKFSLKFNLFNFRVGECPLSSREIVIDIDDDFDYTLDILSAEMSSLIDTYRAISFLDKTLPADRSNTIFQIRRASNSNSTAGASPSEPVSSVDTES